MSAILDQPSTFMVAIAVLLFAIAGFSFLGHVALGRRDAIARRVDQITRARPDSTIQMPPSVKRPGTEASVIGAGILPASEEAELVRRLRPLRLPPDRIIAWFFLGRLALGVMLAVLLALGLSSYGEPIPKVIRLGFLALMGGAAGWFLPLMLTSFLASRRIKAVERGLPDAIELLVVSVEAGLALEDSLDRIVPELRLSQPALAEELAMTAADLKILPSREMALGNLARRVDVPSVRSVVTTLSQTLRYGTPLAQALRVVAAELRNDTLIRLEERANRLPAILTIPMILFFLPAIFLVVGGPAVLRLIDVFGH